MSDKIQILPLALTLCGIAVLCTLGTWQLQRLAWKEGVLSKIEAEYKKSREDLIIDPAFLNENFEYKRALIAGTWHYDKQIAITPRTHDGKVGHHIITPLSVIGGGTLLVNRGWVALDWPFDKDTAQDKASAFVTGLIKRPPRPNAFTPDNNLEKDKWYHLVLSDVVKAKDLQSPVYEYVMLLETELPEAQQSWASPIAKANKPRLNNNHIQYAIFWFTMAGILLVIYVLRFHGSKRLKKNA